MSVPDDNYSKRLIDKKELRKIVLYSHSTIYRMEKTGQFPQRIQIGPARVAWSLSDVLEWVEAKRQGREWQAHRHSDEAA